MKKTEAGSAHVVIVAMLTIALIGALGFIFWQNIINKPTNDSTTAATKTTSPSPSVAVLKSFCAPLEKLCFDYPSNWTVKSESVNPDKDSVAEKIFVQNEAGKSLLELQTGMSGIGGTCGSNDDGSYVKIVQTHTTAVTGSYLVDKVAEKYVSTTAYAVSSLSYDGTTKDWTVSMDLNSNKSVQTVGKIDPCDVGLGVLNGKHAAWSSSTTEPGGVVFEQYNEGNTMPRYGSEAEAMAVLNSSDGKKAYAVLQSARYE